MAQHTGRQIVVATVWGRQGLAVIDVSDPMQITRVAFLRDRTYLNGAFRVVLSADGMLAYVACYLADALTTVDLTVKTAPKVLGYARAPGGILDAAAGIAMCRPEGGWEP